MHTHSVCIKTTNGTKIEYKKLPPISQIVIWFLAFCVLAAFSLCPLAGLATQHNLSAGGLENNTFFINAPVFVAGDTNRNGNTGSADENGALNSTAKDKALFKTDGTINTEVLADLLNMLNDSKVTENPITDNTASGVTYYSAKNFGQYGDQNAWKDAQKGHSQILVKLFETTSDSTSSINALTSQYWQAVYRSVYGENDVLTLYMTRQYIDEKFDSSNANYSTSTMRTVILNDYEALTNSTTGKFKQLDQYVVAPYQLSASGASDMSKTTVNNPEYLNLGGWQSSVYQTSANSSGVTGGAGSSGLDEKGYSVNNGLDGLGSTSFSWTIESNYSDKFWVPSYFETCHTGYSQSNAGKLSVYDEEKNVTSLNFLYTGEATCASTIKTNESDNRTGLWELNAYDRSVDKSIWLRSACYDYGGAAYMITGNGAATAFSSAISNWVRLALHLNVGVLKNKYFPQTKISITATNNAPNSLLILTIMDGSTQIAEYSCIGGGNICEFNT